MSVIVTDNKIMNDYILHKYKQNINKFIDSVHVSPKDYKRKSNLFKRWKVYFYYQHEGKQKVYNLSSFIYSGQNIQINRIKDHETKVSQINHLKEVIINQLNTDTKFVVSLVYGYERAIELYPSIFKAEEVTEKTYISITDAFNYALEPKQGKVSYSFFTDLKSIKNRFIKFVGKNANDDIDLLSKKMLLDFLNKVGAGSSNRTFNNSKSNLSALLTVLKDVEYIPENWLLTVKKLPTKNKINKPYPEEQRLEIEKYLKEKNQLLYFYYLHIYYGLMRPITVTRLKVKHVNLKKRVFETKTKTGDFIKLVTKVLYKECYSKLDLQNADPEAFIFGNKGLLEVWLSEDKNRRNTYTKKFRLDVKKEFDLDSVFT